MMKLDTKHAFLKEDIAGYQDIVTKCHEDLHNKTGKGNDYVGWVEWPNNYDKEEYARPIFYTFIIKRNGTAQLSPYK